MSRRYHGDLDAPWRPPEGAVRCLTTASAFARQNEAAEGVAARSERKLDGSSMFDD
jgi:hypothetical protein